MMKDVVVHPTPAVSGTTPPDVHTNLSWLDAKGAFVTCQQQSGGSDGSQTLSFEEFLENQRALAPFLRERILECDA